MLKIRLQRVGRKHETSFRLVLTDFKNSTKSGRFQEILGTYDPRKSNESFDAERVKYWLSQGASPTATVNNLLITHKIISGSKVHVAAKSKHAPTAPATPTAPESVEGQVEAPKEEIPPAENDTSDTMEAEVKAETV